MSSSSDSWEQGDPYEQYVGRWSREIAPQFLSWLTLPSGLRWLDVGCGTGALTAAILELCAPASVTGVEPSEGFLEKANENLRGHDVLLQQGDALALPLPDNAVDTTVCGLVLNFIPDGLAALREMTRVTVPRGTIAAYVWDYAGKMEIIRAFWDAAVELDSSAAQRHEGARFPLCKPDALTQLFTQGGLQDIEVEEIDITASFRDFDDYWRPFLGGQGPAPAYAMSLSEGARGRLKERLRQRVAPRGNGSISLTARAWAVRGIVAG